MEGFKPKPKPKPKTFTLLVTILAYFSLSQVKAQIGQPINTACTASMIATFTPCMNYITGSSANGMSPSSNCCDAFKSVMSTSMDCACLLVTASVPLPLLVNRTLALGLPRFCKGAAGVPVQCQATASPLPAPGPLQFGAPPPRALPPTVTAPAPSSAFSPQGASKATAAAAPTSDQPASTELPPVGAPSVQTAATTTTTPGIKPLLTPKSSSSSSSIINLPKIWLLLMGFIIFKL